MRTTWLGRVALFGVVFLLATTSQAAVLSGTVYGGTSPLLNTLVEVLPDGTTTAITTTSTATTGRYSFSLPDGTYDLRVTPPPASGYLQGTFQNIVINGANLTAFGVELATYQPIDYAARQSDGTVRFVFLGRLVDWKGVDLLLDAFAGVARGEPRAVLEVLGAGPLLESLKRRSVGLGLAGRVHFIEADGFNLLEVGTSQWSKLWLRGGFPRSFLTDPPEDEDASREWREDFLKTYVMRDIQRLAGRALSPETLAQFLKLIAHFHGQFWNRNEAAATLNVDAKTVQRYVDILAGAYLLRLVPPYERKIGKRVRKAHRLYLRDSGLLHTLLRIPHFDALKTHDRCGASWEGFGVEQVLRVLGGGQDCYFWRTHAGAEIDLIVPTSRGVLGFEFKASTAPTITRGTHEAVADVGVDQLFVIHSGEQEFPLGEKIIALPISRIAKLKAKEEGPIS